MNTAQSSALDSGVPAHTPNADELLGTLNYVKAYLEERSDWPGTAMLIGDIDDGIARATARNPSDSNEMA